MEQIGTLIGRILELTKSPQSEPFYRKAIQALGKGIVEEELRELRYRMHLGTVNHPARYFTSLLQNRLSAKAGTATGRTIEVPLIRGLLFPKDEERGILTAEEGRILGAVKSLWVEQGCRYVRFENGAVSCYCDVPIRRLAQLLGWQAFGGRNLEFLKRKTVNLKIKAYYLELDSVEELRTAGLKGYGFTLVTASTSLRKPRTTSSRRCCG